MRLKIRASVVESLEAQLKADLSPQQKAQLQGLVSRGIKAAEINERGHLIFTLTDNSIVDLGQVVGPQGPPGESSWNAIVEKPFSTIDTDTLKVEDGVLKVNTTNEAEEDNTKPITSAGVNIIVGNIEVLLAAL